MRDAKIRSRAYSSRGRANHARIFEDLQTSTVDGAAAFERRRAERDDEFDELDLWFDGDPGREYIEGEDLAVDPDEDDCMCSDPCCPCEGSKIGVP